jgi:hypothetical protein
VQYCRIIEPGDAGGPSSATRGRIQRHGVQSGNLRRTRRKPNSLVY